MPQSSQSTVGSRPAAQGAMQFATAWKSRSNETQATAIGDDADVKSRHIRSRQSSQAFATARHESGQSRLRHYQNIASKDQNLIEVLEAELKAFDSFAEHSEEEYNDIIAKAKELAKLKHEEIELSELDGEEKLNDERRNSAILSRAKELADAMLKNGLDSKLLASVDTDAIALSFNTPIRGVLRNSDLNKPIAYFAANDPIDSVTCSVVVGNDDPEASKSLVGLCSSAYDEAFGGDHDGKDGTSLQNITALNPGRDNGPFPNPQDYVDPNRNPKPDDTIRAKYEHDTNESDVHHEDPKYWAQGGIDAAKSSSLPAEMYYFDGPIQPGKEGINEGESEDDKNERLMRNALESTRFDAEHDEIPLTNHPKFDSLAGLSFTTVHGSMPQSARGFYMPCFFLYDNSADLFLADEGTCRLLGITYTGQWVPGEVIRNQMTLLDREKLFSTCFSPNDGDGIMAHVRINQGQHQGQRLYITASVVHRNDSGVATLISGHFCQIQTNFMEYLYRIVNNCASYDIDTFAGTISFGYGYQDLLGLSADESLPSTVQEYTKIYVHPEDLIVYKRQNEVINSPNNGDYYESIYRVKHSGGFFLWVIDRGLVVERKRSGKASRIIGTTTNIDVVRSNFERLKRSIYRDPLTGLHNRLYLNTRYKYFTMEESQPLTLCYVDISGLKVINDYLGHAKGDELVKTAAKVLHDDVHLDHEVIRLSGDEFLLIFTNCSDIECKLAMNKFACNLDERNRNFEFPLPIFFGFGVATLGEIDDGDTFMRCEARADARLQEYKTVHRERIYANLRFYIEGTLGHPIDLTDNRRLEYLEDVDESTILDTPNGARIDDLQRELPSSSSQGSILDEHELIEEEAIKQALAYEAAKAEARLAQEQEGDKPFSLTIGVSDAHEVAVHSSKDAIRHPNAALKAGARSAQASSFVRKANHKVEDSSKIPDVDKPAIVVSLEKNVVDETDDVAAYRKALAQYNAQQDLSDNADKLAEAYKGFKR